MKSATGCSCCSTECCTVPTVGHGFKRPHEGRLIRDVQLTDYPHLGTLKKNTIVIKAPGVYRHGSAFIVVNGRLVEVPGDCVEWLPMQSHSNDDERDHVL